jgi:hypothetical protein
MKQLTKRYESLNPIVLQLDLSPIGESLANITDSIYMWKKSTDGPDEDAVLTKVFADMTITESTKTISIAIVAADWVGIQKNQEYYMVFGYKISGDVLFNEVDLTPDKIKITKDKIRA